jgi:hypothetical protein
MREIGKLPAMPQPIHELRPGLVHWSSKHPNIGVDVSSYFLVAERVLLDPIAPPDDLGWFDGREPREILLTNRHHLRSVTAFTERFGPLVVRASRPGMHAFEGEPVDVEPFDFGDELPGGVVAHEVGVICPDESALELRTQRALAVADGVINYGNGLQFVPDHLLGDDPETIKHGLKGAYARLAETVDFDHLLLAHGTPVLDEGRDKLRAFAAG